MERTDQTLIDAVLGGELAAYDALMRRHQGMAFRLAARILRDREAALDVTQNAFLKAYDGLARFQPGTSFRTWLARIVHNEAINWIRRERIRSRGRREMPAAIASPGVRQDAALMSQERREQLMGAVHRLRESHRLAVTLRYFEGMPIREVADVLGCSEGTVKSILFRSVRRLKGFLMETTGSSEERDHVRLS